MQTWVCSHTNKSCDVVVFTPSANIIQRLQKHRTTPACPFPTCWGHSILVRGSIPQRDLLWQWVTINDNVAANFQIRCSCHLGVVALHLRREMREFGFNGVRNGLKIKIALHFRQIAEAKQFVVSFGFQTKFYLLGAWMLFRGLLCTLYKGANLVAQQALQLRQVKLPYVCCARSLSVQDAMY